MVLSEAFSLLLIMGAVALLPWVGRALRLPSPVIEILFGVVLGKSVLQLEMGGDWLPFLAHLGFLVLMFQAGMEINFAMLKRQSKGQLLFQVVFFGATMALAVIAALLVGRGVFVALVLTTTSLGLVMPVLKETGLNKSPLGQNILMSATLADFVTLFGITFFVLWERHGLSWRFVQPLPLFVGFAVLLWCVKLWAWWNPEKADSILRTQDPQQQGVRLSLALLFFFVALSELVRLEPVLGAFLGGCIISFVFRERNELEAKISALGFGFLIPLFFIHVGMQFDVANVLTTDRLMFTLWLFLLAIGVKLLPSLLFPLWRMPLRQGVLAGLLLSSRLSLIVAAASIGLQEGFITAEVKDSIVLLALLTCFVGPTSFKVALRGLRIPRGGL